MEYAIGFFAFIVLVGVFRFFFWGGGDDVVVIDDGHDIVGYDDGMYDGRCLW